MWPNVWPKRQNRGALAAAAQRWWLHEGRDGAACDAE